MRRAFMLFAVLAAASACNRAGATAARAEDASTTPAPVATAGTTDRATPAGNEASRDVTLRAGTRLPIVLDTSVGSDTSRVEEPVHAHLARPVVVNGHTVLPAGTRVSGIVTDATRSGKVKGRAHLAMRFDTLAPAGTDEHYRIRTAAVGRIAPATKKKDALEIGVPAAGGAIIGGLIGGKKGALIGTAAGGGAGTAVVLSTRGKEVHVPKGAALMLRLAEPVTVKVRG
jgi:hypothetical protein